MPLIVEVPKFNTVLDDRARNHYAPVIATLFALSPDMMQRKIAEANVQQAFILTAVVALCRNFPNKDFERGCFEDTAYEALLKMGVSVDGIDPDVNGLDLNDFVKLNPERQGYYDIVFSTSVLEHVEDDERFVGQIADLLRPGGYAILTCDFKEDWRPGDRIPVQDFRFYKSADLKERLVAAMPGCQLADEPDWDQFAPDFHYVGCVYSFASFTLQKKVHA